MPIPLLRKIVPGAEILIAALPVLMLPLISALSFALWPDPPSLPSNANGAQMDYYWEAFFRANKMRGNFDIGLGTIVVVTSIIVHITMRRKYRQSPKTR